MSSSRQEDSEQNSDTPRQSRTSAFPELSADLSVLPDIPGGWTLKEYDFGGQCIRLQQPTDPDQFLEDADVLAASEESDYLPFWAFLWPAAIQMAGAIQGAPWNVGSSVLELGSGLGLVGLAALQRGDAVTFSDYDPTALYLCRKNAIDNQLLEPDVMLLDWRQPSAQTFEVIIGCEVTYDAPMHAVLLDLLDQMLTADGICWLGDPGRYRSPAFHKLAMERGYTVSIYNAALEVVDEPLVQGFQIFELRKPSPVKPVV